MLHIRIKYAVDTSGQPWTRLRGSKVGPTPPPRVTLSQIVLLPNVRHMSHFGHIKLVICESHRDRFRWILTTITERAVRCRALNECLTTDETSNYLMIDDLQAGPLGAARQRPSGGEVN